MTEPAISRYARLFYDELHARSENNIFVGSITKAWASIGASNSYYTKVRAVLLKQECITIEARGAGGSPTVVRLLRPPEILLPEDLTTEREAARLSAAQAEKRIEALEKRLKGVNITEALRDIETRLSKLEQTGGTNGKSKT